MSSRGEIQEITVDRAVPNLHDPARWTATLVLLRLEEAAETLRRLPAATWRPKLVSWPEYVRANAEAAPRSRPLPARPEAIDRLDATLAWLGTLAPESARIVWARASGAAWRDIAALSGQSPRTCQRRMTEALLTIAGRLNRRGGHAQ